MVRSYSAFCSMHEYDFSNIFHLAKIVNCVAYTYVAYPCRIICTVISGTILVVSGCLSVTFNFSRSKCRYRGYYGNELIMVTASVLFAWRKKRGQKITGTRTQAFNRRINNFFRHSVPRKLLYFVFTIFFYCSPCGRKRVGRTDGYLGLYVYVHLGHI